MKKILCLLFLTSTVYADDTTYRILLDRTKLTSANISTILTKGKNIIEAGGQPYRLTRLVSVMPNQNTNYYLIDVTIKNSTEQAYFDNLLTLNKIKLIGSMELIKEYDSRIGGHITYVETTKINDLPDDFLYKVNLSTP